MKNHIVLFILLFITIWVSGQNDVDDKEKEDRLLLLEQRFNKHYLSVDLLHLAYQKLNIQYEYFHDNGKWAIAPAFHWNFVRSDVPLKMYPLNDFQFGLNGHYYPFGQGRFKYFTGLGAEYFLYTTSTFRDDLASAYVINGVLFQLTRELNFSASLYLGQGGTLDFNSLETYANFNLRFGYRF